MQSDVTDTIGNREVHKYLIIKLSQEAESAKVLANNAEKGFSVEEERKLDSSMKNEEFIDKKRKMELKMDQDRAELERKKKEQARIQPSYFGGGRTAKYIDLIDDHRNHARGLLGDCYRRNVSPG